MKKKLFWISLVALGLSLLPGFSAFADPSVDGLYCKYVDKRIENCDRKASYGTCAGTHLRECAQKAVAEGAFLKAHREELLERLKAEQVKPAEYKVNYYLIKSFAQQ